jgi:hypothetical protein
LHTRLAILNRLPSTQTAFDDLWTVLADLETFIETIIPAVDKLLVRSPETGLPGEFVKKALVTNR